MVATTWDPARTGAHIILSNGNLTFTGDGANAFGTSYSTTSKTTSKFMVEITLSGWLSVGNDTPLGIGVGNSSAVTTNYCGSTSDGFNYFLQTGNTYINSSVTSTKLITGWAGGDIVDFAVDFVNQTFWVRRNGGNWFADAAANPATNTNGVSFSTVNSGAKFAATSVQMFFGTVTGVTDFSVAPTYALPSGFNMWDPVAATATARLSPMAIT